MTCPPLVALPLVAVGRIRHNGVVLDADIARAVLRALAESWPEHAAVEQLEVAHLDPRRVVVTVWTSSPGPVIGPGGRDASEWKERLCAALADRDVELRVFPGPRPAQVPQPWGEDPLAEGMPGDPEEGMPGDPGPYARDLVPGLVGLTVPDAFTKARSSGFFLATADDDGKPITYDAAHGEYERWLVMGQSPMPGVLAPLHSQIVVAIEERGGGGQSGDREPRVPGPPGGHIHLARVVAVEHVR